MQSESGFAPGTVLAAKYTVERSVSATATCSILVAREKATGRQVELHVAFPSFRGNAVFNARFARDAAAAKQVRHANLLSVLDAGRTEHGDAFVAMEHVEAEDLATLLTRWGRFSLESAVSYLKRVAAAVSAIHEARIVHGALRPQNFLVVQADDDTPVFKIRFDFSGLDGDVNATADASAGDFAAYFSPEQLERPKMVDKRTDLWALGICFFEFITGSLPFVGYDRAHLITLVRANQRSKLGALIAGLPPPYDALVDRCLELDPEDRFTTIDELATAAARLPVGATVREATRAGAADSASALQALIIPEKRGIAAGSRVPIPTAGEALKTPAPSVAPRARTASAPSNFDLDASPLIETAGMALPDGPIPQLGQPDPSPPQPQTKPARHSQPQLEPTAHPVPRARAPLELQETAPPQRSRAASTPGTSGAPPARAPMKSNSGVTPTPLASAATRPPPPVGRRKMIFIAAGAGAGVILLALIAIMILVPRSTLSAFDDATEKAGLTVTRESASTSLSGVEFTNLQIGVTGLPGTTIRAKHAHLALSGNELVLSDADVASDAPVDDLSRVLAQAKASLPKKLRIDSAHVSYTFARNLTVDGTGATITANANADGTRPIDIAMPEANVATTMGSYGPFAMNVHRAEDGTTLAATPLAGAHPGARVDVTWAQDSTHIVAKFPRGDYALPGKALGVAIDSSLDLQADLDMSVTTAGAVSGTGSVAFFRLTFGPSPNDLSWDFTLAGTSNAFAARNVHARIGPFSGEINGNWSTLERTHPTFAFHTATVPCADLARAKAHQGDVPALLADLADYSGVARVTGRASAAGAVSLILESPPRVQATITENDSCGLSIFPK